MSSIEAKVYQLQSGQFQVSYRNPLDRKRKRNKFATEKEAKSFKEEIVRQYLTGNLHHL